MLGQYGVIAITICGFWKSFYPDGFYLSDILFSPPKSFTVAEVTQDMSNLLAYSQLTFTFIAFLVTDVLQYKTVIIFGALASLAAELLLYFGTTVIQIQTMHIFEGIFRASSVAYRTYIYTQVNKQSYQQMTAVVNIAPRVGTLISAVLAQFLLSAHIADLYTLSIISIAAKTMLLLAAIALPSVTGTVFSADKTIQGNDGTKGSKMHKQATNMLWEEFKMVLSNMYAMQLCLWWIVSQGTKYLVSCYYVQVLWNEVSGEKSNEYNAGVEAVYACFSSIACLVVGKLAIDWQRRGELIIAVGSLVTAVCLIASAYSSSLMLSYSLYVIATSLNDAMFVITSSQVMVEVKNDSFGLIFGINTFLSFGMQATLTFLLTSKNALALPIRGQFEAAGYCFAVLGLASLLKTLYKVFRSLHMFSKSYTMDHNPEDTLSVIKIRPSDVAGFNEFSLKSVVGRSYSDRYML